VIVGAGPSGLAAACVLRDAGARVLVLDEQDAPGGQIHKAVERTHGASPDMLAALGPDYVAGHALARRFRDGGATYWPGATAWHLTDQRVLWVSTGQGSVPVRSRLVMLATGAMERPVPLPGWTLPGVFTAGALQSLIKSSGLVPSGRTVFVGSGPLLYLVAGQCIDLGAKPVAVVETAPRFPSLGALRHLPRALTGDGPRMLAKGLAMRRRLRRARVPIFAGAGDIAIEGRDAAEAVTFRHRGIGNMVRCDVVALHEGVIPNTQFARLIGCDLAWNARQRCFEPVVDGYGNSSIDGVMVIGDGASVEGAAAAECRGELAAWEALRHLGRISAGERDRRSEGARRGRARQRAIRPLLDALYPPPAAVLTPRDGTIVCRCEEITAGQVRAAVGQGVRMSDQLKGATRCGMGPCQGRLCGPVVAEIIAAETGLAVAEVGLFRVRVPLKPITMGELAAVGD
jgi:NADPH-dependent 2,4-dienoyl-CoA reductase/sulfur reductase-like enzyme